MLTTMVVAVVVVQMLCCGHASAVTARLLVPLGARLYKSKSVPPHLHQLSSPFASTMIQRRALPRSVSNTASPPPSFLTTRNPAAVAHRMACERVPPHGSCASPFRHALSQRMRLASHLRIRRHWSAVQSSLISFVAQRPLCVQHALSMRPHLSRPQVKLSKLQSLKALLL